MIKVTPVIFYNFRASLIVVSLFLLTFLSVKATAQSTTCDSVFVNAVGDTSLIKTDPRIVGVVIDKDVDKTSMEALCINIVTPGAYRIFTGVEYSVGQGNESFYLQIRHEDGSFARLSDPNAGAFKVVPDTSKLPFEASRDAGLFNLKAGINTIILNHYFLIADLYPQFINPNTDGFDGPESVHIFNFQLIYNGEFKNPYDLELSKRASVDTAHIGQPFAYNLNIENLGPATAHNIILADKIPKFVTIDPNSFTITPDSTSTESDINGLFWHFDSLATMASKTISFTAMVNPSDFLPPTLFELVNTSEVISKCDTNKTNNSTSDTVIIEPPPVYDLTLSKTASADTVEAGDEFSYALTIANLGTDPALNITLTDTLPEFITPLNWPGTQTDQILFLNIDALAPAQDTTITFDARVDLEPPDSLLKLVNTGRVTAEYDADSTNNFASDIVYVQPKPPVCDLALSKTASADTVEAGDEFSYTLTIANLGTDPAFNITLTDTLPEFITPLNWPGTQTDQILFLNIDALAPAQDTTITFDARVDLEPSDSLLKLVNTSRVTAECDADSTNNFASIPVYVQPKPPVCDLSLSKTASADTVEAGDEFSYTLTIANLGTDPAFNITLTDTLPEFITPLNWPGTQSGNILVLNLAMLAPTQDTTITFTVRVAAPLTNTILQLINTSQVMATCDEDTTNNFATAPVILKPPILDCDLKLAKTASVDTVRANTEFTYHLNIDNIGIHTAFNITLVDTIPEFITPSNFNRQPNSKINNILFWQFDSLAPGHNTTVIFTAKVNTSLPDNVTEIVNKSGVTADCDVDNISNNFESFSVIVTEFMENCSLFNLDVNVYEPEKGDRLGINFELNSSRTVRLDVLDISGYRIKTLTEATFNAGLNRVEWDGLTETGQKVGSGVYIITLRSGNLKCWKKVIVAR